MQDGFGSIDELYECANASTELKDLFLAVALVDQFDAHAIVQERQLTQAFGQYVVMKLHVAEDGNAWHEMNLCAAPLRRPRLFQRGYLFAIAKLHLVDVPIAPNSQPQPLRQRIDHGDADSMQASG